MQSPEHNNRLPKSVDIRSYNRPAKVAFLIPTVEDEKTHWILDGIFYEAYSRWGGTHSLIIPFQGGQPEKDEYMDWLENLDPDFVYSFVDLDEKMIREIDQLITPIEMIRHEVFGEPDRWRDYIPKWPHGFDPVKSISTLTSPLANVANWFDSPTPQIYLTQFDEINKERFLPNNFGVSHDTSTSTYGQKGVFETLCYCDENLPKNHIVGDYRNSSLVDILEKLAKRKVRTFSHLASIYTEGICHPSNRLWNRAFNIFIGDSVNDRLHFWNSRHLSNDVPQNDIASLIVSPELIKDEGFLYQLGQFLNNNNFKRMNNGPSQVSIRSLSIEKAQCEIIASKLQALTWNQISVTDDYNSYALQNPKENRDYYSSSGTACPSLKVNDSVHNYIAFEPEHFKYITSNFLHAKSGQWLVELEIERHQNDSEISNRFNDWKLPRRYEVVKAFTQNQGRINASHNLVVIPRKIKEFNIFQPHQNYDATIKLSFPDNEDVFRYMIIKIRSLDFYDMRVCLNRDNKYEDIRISDKGQKHRGVVALFNNELSLASLLTNLFWRKVIRGSQKKQNEKYSIDKLTSPINDLKDVELKHLIEQMQFDNVKTCKKYLRDNLKDAVEYLVHNNVLQQIHSWRCTYCGNSNKRSLDTIKRENICDVCSTEYQSPIDMEWEYIVSPYVLSALAEHNGLTVLWGISHLLRKSILSQSLYLPEIDLYRKYDDDQHKNEVDLIAIIDGNFIIAEVKRSAASFIDKTEEADKFVDEVNRLCPDVAYLIFEKICDDENDKKRYEDHIKDLVDELMRKIPKTTELKIVVASQEFEFSEFPSQLGPYGRRTMRMLDQLE